MGIVILVSICYDKKVKKIDLKFYCQIKIPFWQNLQLSKMQIWHAEKYFHLLNASVFLMLFLLNVQIQSITTIYAKQKHIKLMDLLSVKI